MALPGVTWKPFRLRYPPGEIAASRRDLFGDQLLVGAGEKPLRPIRPVDGTKACRVLLQSQVVTRGLHDEEAPCQMIDEVLSS